MGGNVSTYSNEHMMSYQTATTLKCWPLAWDVLHWTCYTYDNLRTWNKIALSRQPVLLGYHSLLPLPSHSSMKWDVHVWTTEITNLNLCLHCEFVWHFIFFKTRLKMFWTGPWLHIRYHPLLIRWPNLLTNDNLWCSIKHPKQKTRVCQKSYLCYATKFYMVNNKSKLTTWTAWL